MYVTNIYDQFYVYIIINELMYNLARHKNIMFMYTFMYVTNIYVQLYVYYIYMYSNITWRANFVCYWYTYIY